MRHSIGILATAARAARLVWWRICSNRNLKHGIPTDRCCFIRAKSVTPLGLRPVGKWGWRRSPCACQCVSHGRWAYIVNVHWRRVWRQRQATYHQIGKRSFLCDFKYKLVVWVCTSRSFLEACDTNVEFWVCVSGWCFKVLWQRSRIWMDPGMSKCSLCCSYLVNKKLRNV